MNLPSKNDVKLYLKWLATNDNTQKILEDLRPHFGQLEKLGVDVSLKDFKYSGLKQRSELLYKETIDALKGAMERLDRTLAVVLIATGWVATAREFDIVVFLLFLASSAVLFCGRIKVETTSPGAFADNVSEHRSLASFEEYENLIEFVDARQYEKARAQNDMQIEWIQHRIGLGTILFASGLVCLAISRMFEN